MAACGVAVARHKLLLGLSMARGRKNHGVRQARWLKMWKRQQRRKRHSKNGRKKHWKRAKDSLREPYMRSKVTRKGVGHYYVPLWMTERRPHALAAYGQPSHGTPLFAKFGHKNPHTHVVWEAGRTHNYRLGFPSGFVRRQQRYFGHRYAKQTRYAHRLAMASRWYWSTVMYHGRHPTEYQVGWPLWDPRGRTPAQLHWAGIP